MAYMGRGNMMRSANPALSTGAFEVPVTSDDRMSVDGTVNKTGISLFILMLTAFYSWQTPYPAFMFGGMVGGFVLAIVTIFKKTWAPYTVPLYAMCQGLFLGVLSQQFEMSYPGIAGQAIFLTFGVLGALLMAYKANIIRATPAFKRGVICATGGIFLVYFINFIMSFFGASIPIIASNSLFGIGFSLFVVVIAALNLVFDFDFIEEASQRGAPKYMEWYGAFGLLVTLIWLYIEILRLLAKLQSRRD